MAQARRTVPVHARASGHPFAAVNEVLAYLRAGAHRRGGYGALADARLQLPTPPPCVLT